MVVDTQVVGWGFVFLALALVVTLPALLLHFRGLALVRWLEAGREGGEARRTGTPALTATVTGANGGAQLALVVTEVAARLRAGAPSEEAWRLSWGRYRPRDPPLTLGVQGVPSVVEDLARLPPLLGRIPFQVGWFAQVRRALEARRPAGRAIRRAAVSLRVACRFTHGLGAPVATVLDTIAEGIDEGDAAEEARRVACAGAVTSAQVLTAMPMVGFAVAWALDADPVARFADGALGSAACVVGVSMLLAGHLVARGMVAKVADGGRIGPDGPFLCDLVVAGLESGASVPAVLEALGRAVDEPEVGRCARELRLGVSWARAWEGLPAEMAMLAGALEPAWCEGACPVSLLRRAAAQTRSRRVAQARVEAARLGVRLVLPLGALLLPAFVALGVVPVVLHLIESGFAPLM